VFCRREGGKLFISQDINDLIKKLKFMINNTELIYQMKRNCLEDTKKYNNDTLINEFIKGMKLQLLKK